MGGVGDLDVGGQVVHHVELALLGLLVEPGDQEVHLERGLRRRRRRLFINRQFTCEEKYMPRAQDGETDILTRERR